MNFGDDDATIPRLESSLSSEFLASGLSSESSARLSSSSFVMASCSQCSPQHPWLHDLSQPFGAMTGRYTKELHLPQRFVMREAAGQETRRGVAQLDHLEILENRLASGVTRVPFAGLCQYSESARGRTLGKRAL